MSARWSSCHKAGVEVAEFAKVMENPVKEMVMEGAAFARENGCDFIVALGGGAVLDSAVAVAAMATNPGDLWDYVNGGTGKGQPLLHPGLPIVTITLTAGTGSEVNCWGVISNLETKEKIGFGYPGADASPRRCGSGADENCARKIHGLSGL